MDVALRIPLPRAKLEAMFQSYRRDHAEEFEARERSALADAARKEELRNRSAGVSQVHFSVVRTAAHVTCLAWRLALSLLCPSCSLRPFYWLLVLWRWRPWGLRAPCATANAALQAPLLQQQQLLLCLLARSQYLTPSPVGERGLSVMPRL